MRFVCAAVMVGVVALALAGCPRAATETEVVLKPDDESADDADREGKAMEPGVTITYYGHACFTVTDSQGTSVAIDPFGEGVGYAVPVLSADVCLVTHEHFDHNNVAAVAGDPVVVKTAGETEAKGITVFGVEAPHHEPGENEQRGDVVMMRWAMDGLNLIHLGDLGTSLVQAQIDALGPADVLFLPVGGHFTIDAAQALETATALEAKVVIPMHYRTDASAERLPIAPVDDFLALVPDGWVVSRLDANTVTIPRSQLDQAEAPTRVIVLNYK